MRRECLTSHSSSKAEALSETGNSHSVVAVSHFSFLIYQEDVVTGSLIIRKKHGQCNQLQHQFNWTKVGRGRAEGLREVAGKKRQDVFFSSGHLASLLLYRSDQCQYQKQSWV